MGKSKETSAKRREMTRRMRWIETSLRVMGRVDIPAYRKVFHLSAQNATKDFHLFSQNMLRCRDVGLVPDSFFLRRGRLFVNQEMTTVMPDHEIFGSLALSDWIRMTLPASFEVIDAGVMTPPPEDIHTEIARTIIASSHLSDEPGHRLKITYFSSTSGESEKEISPHTIVQAAGRYHVRAYDHTRNRGADFVMGRILDAQPAQGIYYPAERDGEWMQEVSIRLSVQHETTPEIRRAMRLSYALNDDTRIIKTRAALADYVILAYGLRPKTYPEPAIAMEILPEPHPSNFTVS